MVLHNSTNFVSQVAMYKRLYEEQLKVPPSLPHSAELGSGFMLGLSFIFNQVYVTVT